jgi:signal transduction histidine kinase
VRSTRAVQAAAYNVVTDRRYPCQGEVGQPGGLVAGCGAGSFRENLTGVYFLPLDARHHIIKAPPVITRTSGDTVATTMWRPAKGGGACDTIGRRHSPRRRFLNPTGRPDGLGSATIAGRDAPQDVNGRDPAAEAETAFEEWRGQSARLMLILFGFSVLPHLGAWLISYQLPGRTQWIAVALTISALVVAGVAARRWSAMVRVWLLLLVSYLAAVHGLIWYTGAMARVWLLGAPILALTLAGPRSAFVAAAVSIALIVLHAVSAMTGIGTAWHVEGFVANDPAVVVSESIMWIAFFLPMLILTRNVHLFHLRTLKAERAVTARLEAEVAARRVVHKALTRASAHRARLEREIARVGDEERSRLGQDLHDGASQQLAVALLQCMALENRLGREYPEGVGEVKDLGALLESTMDEVHEVARSLTPVAMDPDALGPALRSLARRTAHSFGVECGYRELGDVRVSDCERTVDLYRIAQEAVNNAGKHARARRITLTLDGGDGQVLLTVEDDGRGLPEEASGTGLGLRIMALRATRMGGTLVVGPAPTGGTRLVCRVPREPRNDH